MNSLDNTFDDTSKWLAVSDVPAVWTYGQRNQRDFDLRMVVIRLTDNSLLVYSPVPKVDPSCFQTLDSFGKVAYILAPNHYHNLGIASFLERYPTAKLLSSPEAFLRLRKVTSHRFDSFESIRGILPTGIDLKSPAGLKGGELWITVHSQNAGNILIVCDSFFNMNQPKKGFFKYLMKFAGGTPGLRVSRMYRLIAGKDLVEYALWARREIESLKPVILVPSHGDILKDENLAKTLVALI